jgi:hypothetical protein
MAYVAISRDLQQRVSSKIGNMCRAELNTIGEEPPITLSPNIAVIDNALWGEHLHLKNAIPKDWCRLDNDFTACYKVVNGESEYSHQFRVKFTEEAKFRPNFSYYTPVQVDHTAPEFASHFDWVKRKWEIAARWDKVGKQVGTFLDSCKSLNEAVKLWPDVKAYLDDNDIARLDVKPARSGSAGSSAAQVLATLDTDEIMGAAVIARMSGA